MSKATKTKQWSKLHGLRVKLGLKRSFFNHINTKHPNRNQDIIKRDIAELQLKIDNLIINNSKPID